jgi:hypothetical protein
MIESYRRQPTQKALPLTDWPRADREAWLAAQAKAGVLDDGGMASHLSACTLEDLTRRYAYFLCFLTEEAKFNPPAAASVTEENILLYVHYLEPRVSSVTLAQSIYKIARVAACLAPERDWRWLKRVARRLDLRAKPRDKRHEVVEIRALFELGLHLMDKAEKTENLTSLGDFGGQADRTPDSVGSSTSSHAATAPQPCRAVPSEGHESGRSSQ